MESVLSFCSARVMSLSTSVPPNFVKSTIADHRNEFSLIQLESSSKVSACFSALLKMFFSYLFKKNFF